MFNVGEVESLLRCLGVLGLLIWVNITRKCLCCSNAPHRIMKRRCVFLSVVKHLNAQQDIGSFLKCLSFVLYQLNRLSHCVCSYCVITEVLHITTPDPNLRNIVSFFFLPSTLLPRTSARGLTSLAMGLIPRPQNNKGHAGSWLRSLWASLPRDSYTLMHCLHSFLRTISFSSSDQTIVRSKARGDKCTLLFSGGPVAPSQGGSHKDVTYLNGRNSL